MKCVLKDCEEGVAPGRTWFCEGHYEEAKAWWRSALGHDLYLSTVALARALQAIGATVDLLVQAIEAPWNYAEEAYWHHTLREHDDHLATATTVATLAPEGARQQRAGAFR